MAAESKTTQQGVTWTANYEITDNGPDTGLNSWCAAVRGVASSTMDTVPGAPRFRDSTGVVGQGFIAGGVQYGRCGGGVFEAVVQPGHDGLAIAVEAGIVNMGSEEHDPDGNRPKVAFWTGVHREGYAGPTAGGKRATAIMAIAHTLAAGGSFIYGLLLRHVAKWFISMKDPSEPGAIGVLMWPHQNWGEAMRIPQGVPITAWSADGKNVMPILFTNQWNQVCIGQNAGGVAIQFPDGIKALELGPPDAQGYRAVRVKA